MNEVGVSIPFFIFSVITFSIAVFKLLNPPIPKSVTQCLAKAEAWFITSGVVTAKAEQYRKSEVCQSNLPFLPVEVFQDHFVFLWGDVFLNA